MRELLRAALEYAEENEDSRLVRTVLAPLLVLSWGYGVVMDSRWLVRELVREVSVPCAVIGVGNITVGGTGKTPLVALVAERLVSRGLSVGVVSHGYGRNSKDRFVLIRGATPSSQLARRAGDEAVLLSRMLTRVPVASGKSKGYSLTRLWKRVRPQVALIDDAFQSIRLKRDLDIVAVDAVNPWGCGYLLPRGRLREKKENLSRADLIVLTRCNQSRTVPELKVQLGSLTDAAVVTTEHLFGGVWRPDTWQELPSGLLSGKNVYAFSGIANPSSFERSLSDLGASVVAARRFADHHFFSVSDIEKIEDAASKLGAEFLVTTDKDAVRLSEGVKMRAGGRILVVGTKLRVTEGVEVLDGLLLGTLARRGLSLL